MAHGVIRAPSPATGSKVAVHMGDPTIPIGIERWQNATADNQQKTLSRAAFCRPVSFSILPMPEPHSPIAPALLFGKNANIDRDKNKRLPCLGLWAEGPLCCLGKVSVRVFFNEEKRLGILFLPKDRGAGCSTKQWDLTDPTSVPNEGTG